MSILARDKILERLKAARLDRRLVITPILDKHQIGPTSVDVRLGVEFLQLPRSSTGAQTYDAMTVGDASYKMTRRDFGEPLFLHPGQLVLGSTFEFVSMPPDLACYVIGRSSLGRTGLVIATATGVSAGYRGCITLEIANVGEVPLPLYPGMRVAQLVLHDTQGAESYKGRFTCSTGPVPPLLSRDREMPLWQNRGKV